MAVEEWMVGAENIPHRTIQVPWKRLRSEPIRVILSELTVLATPAKAAGPEALAARRQRIKLAKLATDEALRETQWSESKLERTAQTRAYSRYVHPTCEGNKNAVKPCLHRSGGHSFLLTVPSLPH